ncbi:MAG: alpha/beta hydrolase family protein [Myxococcota bacterium]
MRLAGAALLVSSLLACGGRSGGRSDAGCAAATPVACEYEVGSSAEPRTQTLSVTDATTGRVLPVLARLPASGTGPFPVVVWSHGGGLADHGQTFSPEWGRTLAQHGFVALSIGHVSLTVEAGTAVCTRGGVPSAECLPPVDDDEGLLTLVKALDVHAVLEALPAVKAELATKATLDLARVGVIGWSAGARGPLTAMGTTFLPTVSAPVFSLPHLTPKAAVALSPMGPGWAGYFDGAGGHSWEGTRGPTLVVTGDNDVKPQKPGLTGATRRVVFERQPADGKRWLLYSNLAVGVGGHPTYNLEDLESDDARLSRLSKAIRSTVLAFFDAELRDDVAARAWLESDAAKTLAGDADWAHR